MADIGVIPLKTAVEITTTTGQNGTIPGATASAAGAMTAEHVKMLEELWKFHRTRQAPGGEPQVIVQKAAAIDTSQFATRMELQQGLSSIPRSADFGPSITALRANVDDVQRKLRDLARPQAPAVVVHQDDQGEVVDVKARETLLGVIAGMSRVDDRVADLESAFETLRAVAKSKAATEGGG